MALLPVVAFLDSIPTDYAHSMDGSGVVGAPFEVEFVPYDHDMIGGGVIGAPSTFVLEHVESMEAGALIGGWSYAQEHPVSMVAAGQVGAGFTVEFLPIPDSASVTIPGGYVVNGVGGLINGGAHVVDLPQPVSVSAVAFLVNHGAIGAASLPTGKFTVTAAGLVGRISPSLPGGITATGSGRFHIIPAGTVAPAIPGGIAASASAALVNVGVAAPALPAGVSVSTSAHLWITGAVEVVLRLAPSVAAVAALLPTAIGSVTLPRGISARVVGGLTNLGTGEPSFGFSIACAASQAVTLALERVVSMTVSHGAVSEYEGFDFNSLATFNGRVLLAGPGGISEHVGDSDDGAPIAARFRLGNSEHGSPALKRPRIAWLVGRLAGYMRVSVIAAGNQYDYSVIPHGDDVKAHRAPLGRGVKHNFLQFEVANEDGSDFDLEALRVQIDGAVARRVNAPSR